MVRVIAGYIVNEERLIAYLESVGCGPLYPDGIPDFSDVYLAWINWYNEQPKETRVPRPNCFLEGDKWFLAFVTRGTPERPAPDVALHESPADREIRDRFIARTGNKLDATSMQFMNRPQGVFRYPFVVVGG